MDYEWGLDPLKQFHGPGKVFSVLALSNRASLPNPLMSDIHIRRSRHALEAVRLKPENLRRCLIGCLQVW